MSSPTDRSASRSRSSGPARKDRRQPEASEVPGPEAVRSDALRPAQASQANAGGKPSKARKSAAAEAPAQEMAPSTSPNPEGRRPPRANARARILQAATTCFLKDGFHGASMHQICAEAGMSPGALYRYFPSKEALIAAIVQGEKAERAELLEQIENAPVVLEGLFAALDGFFNGEFNACVALSPEIMAESIRNTKLREAMSDTEAETTAVLSDALVRAVAQGEIDPTLDLEDISIMLQAVGDGLVLHHQLNPDWHIEQRMGAIGELLRRMLAPQKSSAI